MTDIGTALVVGVGGAALLAALAFRQLIETVIRLNDELQEAIQDRQANAEEREALSAKISLLEGQLAEHQAEIRGLQQRLSTYRQLLQQQGLTSTAETPRP